MYKYIVYCSVSAAIIILSKYLYQHWIKQNHIISSLKQELTILTDKVKRMECEMEKNKHIFSGGVQIPITFAKSPTSPSPSPSPSPKSPNPPQTIILLQDDISDLTLSSQAGSLHSSSSSSSSSSVSKSKSSSKSKTLDICEPPPSPPSPPSPKSPTEEQEQKQKQEQEEEAASMATTTTTNERERRKKKLPDAKQYSNGSKFKDEEGNCEYLCVVGKRGGHSWKKI